jgi:hypothetical protein
MCWTTSNINSDINGSWWNVYLVTGWSHRIYNNGYPKYNHDLYGNLRGSGLSSCNRYRNGNNQPTSTNYRNLDGLFGLNISIGECGNSRHMEQLESRRSNNFCIRSSNGIERRNEHHNVQRFKWMQYNKSIHRISTTGINSNTK